MSHRPYIIETERLGMRRYAVTDLEALRSVFADPYAARFYPAMNTTAALERWIKWNLDHDAEHGFCLWAVVLRRDQSFIGDAGITYQTVEGKRVLEIGWHIGLAHRSVGYASEAGLASLKYAFEVLGASDIGSIVDPANGASCRVASRVHAQRRTFQGKAGSMLFYTTSAEHYAARANPSFDDGPGHRPAA